MDELGRPRRSAGREILSLDKTDAESARSGVQSSTTAGSPAADDEDVKGVSGAGADQGGLLDGARRYGGERVRNFVLDIGEGGSGGGAVTGGNRRVAEDGEVGTAGDGGEGTDASEA